MVLTMTEDKYDASKHFIQKMYTMSLDEIKAAQIKLALNYFDLFDALQDVNIRMSNDDPLKRKVSQAVDRACQIIRFEV